MSELDFLSHIERQAQDLPVIVYQQRKLLIQLGRDKAENFGHEFLVDMRTVRTGWVEYKTGSGRVVTAVLVGGGTAMPAKPSDKAKAVGLVPMMSEHFTGELEIADVALRNAFADLYRVWKAQDDGTIPQVRFVAGATPRFELVRFVPRLPDMWGE